ncbi:hypothetical protein [Bradyrhizobium acaciae]|uniref:hypothetical protein n=1 Tax=Bradyrhizobium acaciae TaxID=2683706 RepID=UPI001E5038A5|nr:hypothetical protein [Bradyrhizobium acaciae]MCC8977929.1 hypothetical protein [Bradyrhizobium acaciae]
MNNQSSEASAFSNAGFCDDRIQGVAMVGDLQAIAGKAIPEIPSLDALLLECSAPSEGKASQSKATRS